MTVLGADYSNFNAAPVYAGMGFVTHKATEGTSVTHNKYVERLNTARAAGVPVLGSYHVVRTPGVGGGSLAQQLTYWVAYLDAHTPWWRKHPNWVMQVDAEKWPYDSVSATTVRQFAALLVQSGLPGYKVTYASRGQYGDSLSGIATDLWNADYRGGPSYPGDGFVRVGTSPAGWAPFSGKTPTFLQYTSTPYDKDAFRGSLAELLTLTRSTGAGPSTEETDMGLTADESAKLDAVFNVYDKVKLDTSGDGKPDTDFPVPLTAMLKRIEAKLDALAAAAGEHGALTPADVTAVEAAAEHGARDALEGATAVIHPAA